MRACNRHLAAILLTSTALISPALVEQASAQNLPTGASVQQGGVTVSTPSATQMTINQSTQSAIVNWNSFSIGAGNRVDIVQPSSSSAMLNRVTGSAPSTIAGQLNASGQVYLVNPNGIVITRSGTVNAAGFVASTLGISDDDFKQGKRSFTGTGHSADVSNAGTISIGRGGYAALLGGQVSNSGTIVVPEGKVGFGAAEQATLDLSDDGFLQVAAPSTGTRRGALIRHSGSVSGHVVEMQAATARNAARRAINMSGVVEASSVGGRSGAILLGGGPAGAVKVSGRLAAAGGTVKVSGRKLDVTGTIDTSGAKGGKIALQSSKKTSVSGKLLATGSTDTGGTVEVLGQQVALNYNAFIDVSGMTGGGTALIGGDFQGKKAAVQNAQRTFVGTHAVIKADAIQTGNGGKVIVWADDITLYYGAISAKGGAQSGNGGFVEVSGKQTLVFNGSATVAAPNGLGGTILLDPANINIVAGAGGADDAEVADSAVAFADAAASTFTISEAALEALTGNVVLQASADITSNATLDFANQTAGERVVFQAGGNITINNAITTAGAAIILEADSPHSSAGAANGAGTVTIGAALNSGGGAITLIGADFAINSAVNAGAGMISIAPTASAAMTLGTGVLSSAEINQFNSTAGLQIGRATTAGSDGLGTGAQTLTTGSITINAALAPAGVTTLVLNSSGGITQTAGSTITETNLGLVAGTGVTLTEAGNNVTSLTGLVTGTGDFSYVDVNAVSVFNLTSVNATATTGIQTTNGSISLQGTTVNLGANLLTDSLGAGSSVTITGPAILTVASVTIDTDSTAGGTAGNVTFTSTVNGTSSGINSLIVDARATGGTGGNVTFASTVGATTGLGNLGVGANSVSFSGTNGASLMAVVLTGAGQGIDYTDINGLQIGVVGSLSGVQTNAGDIRLTAAGNLTIGGAGVRTSGAASIDVRTTGAASDLTFNSGVVSTNGTGVIQLIAGRAITASSATGINMDINSTGAVRLQAVTNIGTTTNRIDTTNIGTLAVSAGGNVFINHTGALAIGSVAAVNGASPDPLNGITTTGNLALTTTGALTQSQAFTITGTTTLTAGAANNITLTQVSNDFGGAVSVVSGKDVSITNTNAVSLAASTISGNFALTAGGAVTQSGTVSVTGTSSLTAGSGNNITLSDANNNFTGAVSVVSANDVSLTDTNAIVLGASTISGNFSLTTGGAVTQTDALGVAGTTGLTAGTGNNITLTHASNNFTGAVTVVSGNDVALTDTNALTLAAVTANGTLNATAGGAMTVSGAVSSAGATLLRATGGTMTIGATGSVTSTAAGTAVTLAASGNFSNSGGANAVQATNGRWLVYSTDPTAGGDNRGGLVYGFKQYNATYGVTTVAQATGNGFLYSVAPTLTPGLTGTVTKTYDGTTVATLASANYTATGMIDGDAVTLGSASANYDTPNVGTNKTVTANGIAFASGTNGAAAVYGYQMASTSAAANIGTITAAPAPAPSAGPSAPVSDAWRASAVVRDQLGRFVGFGNPSEVFDGQGAAPILTIEDPRFAGVLVCPNPNKSICMLAPPRTP